MKKNDICLAFYVLIRIFAASRRAEDALHSFATALAMAQERIRICADFLQQQPAEVGSILAHADRLHGILPYLQRHLLFQRPA